MERASGWTWWLFALMTIGLGMLVVGVAVSLALLPRWPSAYAVSLASQLSADYSAEPDAVTRLAPVKPELVFDVMVENDQPEAPLPPGPLATLEAIASATPTFTPSPTHLPTDTSTPTFTSTPTCTPTSTPTPTYTPTPRPTFTPTITPTAIVTVTLTASPAPTSKPDEPQPTQPPPPTATQPTSPLAPPVP